MTLAFCPLCRVVYETSGSGLGDGRPMAACRQCVIPNPNPKRPPPNTLVPLVLESQRATTETTRLQVRPDVVQPPGDIGHE